MREVGSIVLGVLIALAIGEVADTMRHRHNVAKLMVTVRNEMGATRVVLEERMMSGRCIIRRHDQIKAALAEERVRRQARRVQTIGLPKVRPLANVAWATLVGNEELLYINLNDADIAKHYFITADKYLDYQSQEQITWANLRVLESRPDLVSGDLMAELETSIEEAHANAFIINIMAHQMWKNQHLLGMRTDYTYFDDMGREQMIAKAKANPLCRSL
ncbi:MAG: hypothetical protein EOP94_00720 [Zymomonas sp.]|nr:MAG: hypothetical protein EOP94_00720 [Zymomonas sp.]